MNLLHETIDDIKRSGHSLEDVVFIGSRESGHRCSWAEFEILADRQYYAGFGGQEVASDLEVIFSDNSSMRRIEYDGSESWEYSVPFVMPEDSEGIKTLFCKIGWDSLKEINEEGKGRFSDAAN